MSSAPDNTGTSATVYDFICLFTHDLKRKQKRWQDGRLKYHTFNKKLMVYDDRGHFVGESHWQEDGDLEDGSELALERGAALVQVAECVGSRNQDLTELVEKRAKEVEMRRASKASRNSVTAASTPSNSRTALTTHAHHLQQRPLSSLVRGPGPTGRAVVPSVSPYESRVTERNLYMVAPGTSSTSKRKRSVSPPSKMGHARALFGTQLSLCATPLSLSQVRRAALSQKPANVVLPSTVTIDPDLKLSDSDNGDNPPQAIAPEEEERHVGQVAKKHEPALQQTTEERIVIGNSPPVGTRNACNVVSTNLTEKPEVTHPQNESHKMILPKKATHNEPGAHRLSKRQRSPSLGSQITRKRKTIQQNESTQVSAQTHLASSMNHVESRGADEPIDLTEEPPSGLAAPRQSTTNVQRAKTNHKSTPKQFVRSSEDLPTNLTKPGTQRQMENINPATRQVVADPVELLHSIAAGHRGNEPRTELRIRSRQRRGLLMISEKKQKASSNPNGDLTSALNDVTGRSKRDSNGAGCEAAPMPRLSRPDDPYELPVSDDEPVSREAREAVPNARQADVHPQDQDRGFEAWLGLDSPCSEELAISTDEHNGTERATTRLSTAMGKSIDTRGQRQLEHRATVVNAKMEDQVSKGPRIARLARKSIKSREIIGFVPAEGVDFHMPFAHTTSSATTFTGLAAVSDGPAVTVNKKEAMGTEHNTIEMLPISVEHKQMEANEEHSVAERSSPTGPMKSVKASVLTTRTAHNPVRGGIPPNEPRASPNTTEVTIWQGNESPRQIEKERKTPKPDLDRERSLLEERGPSPEHQEASTAPKHPSQALAANKDEHRVEILKTLDPLERVRMPENEQVTRHKPAESTLVASKANADGQSDTDDGMWPQQSSAPASDQKAMPLKPSTESATVTEANLIKEASSVTQQLSAVESIADDASMDMVCLKSADQSGSAQASGSTMTKRQAAAGGPRQISNPATRGRKAAGKKDAAGMAPRTLVQLDPPRPMITRRTGLAAATRPAVQVKNSSVPGFSSAAGGAWSKHAQDLLGITRPGTAGA